jgi:hypothetical protein
LNNERRQIKRKRPNSPTSSNLSNQRPILQRSMPIKNEEEDIMMTSPSNTPNHHYQQTIYPTLPPCSDVLQHRFYDRTLSSRTRSISSSVVQPQTSPLTHYNIRNPMSVQPIPTIPKQNRKQMPLPSHLYDRNNNHYYGFDIRANEESIHNRINIPNSNNNPLNIPGGILRFDQRFPNVTTMQPQEEKIRKTLSADESLKYYHHERQVNMTKESIHFYFYSKLDQWSFTIKTSIQLFILSIDIQSISSFKFFSTIRSDTFKFNDKSKYFPSNSSSYK